MGVAGDLGLIPAVVKVLAADGPGIFGVVGSVNPGPLVMILLDGGERPAVGIVDGIGLIPSVLPLLDVGKIRAVGMIGVTGVLDSIDQAGVEGLISLSSISSKPSAWRSSKGLGLLCFEQLILAYGRSREERILCTDDIMSAWRS